MKRLPFISSFSFLFIFQFLCAACIFAQEGDSYFFKDKKRDFKKHFVDKNKDISIKIKNFRQMLPQKAEQCTKRTMNSHNNVDLIHYKGEYFMAYRTAPTHFASKKTRMHIMRSKDGENWTCEHTFAVGADMREPRFLILNEQLFFYFFEGGTNIFKFEPRKIWASKLTVQNVWSDIVDTKMDGYVPWRFRNHEGKAYLSAYYGVGLYGSGNDCVIRLFTTDDGFTWTPISKEPQTKARGAEEAEFIFDDSGDLWATVRLEGDGGLIVHAASNDLTKWDTVRIGDKYDSALMFKHKGAIYLIARRNVSGKVRSKPWWCPKKSQRTYNMLRYWWSTKRTTLYRVETDKKAVTPLFDLPSNGDTAFAGIAPNGDNSFLVVNYSNDPRKRDRTWFSGQLGKTNLYSFVLQFD